MTIVFNCGDCGSRIQAPDNLVGQQARCPTCQAVVTVPEKLSDAEEVPSQPSQSRHWEGDITSPSPTGSPWGERSAYGEEPGEEGRRPCPMCGEKILTSAIKCRYCGEVFDPALRSSVGSRYGGRAGGGNRPLASLGARFGGAMLDGLAGMVAVLPGLLIIMANLDAPRRQRNLAIEGVVVMGLGALVLMIIQVVMLSTNGQSIGKKAVGTRIVNYHDGSNPGFGGAVMLRGFVPGLIGAIPYIGGFFSLVDILCIFGAERRCIHDMIAGTCVVEA
jgi:uncharacterized RDD family membrane protein YckC/DNA-directed RNA polymerase subunit RPC12/RpoP